MLDIAPLVVENRYFVELEEEDIQKLNHQEAAKFEHNPNFTAVASTLEAKLGPGEWSEHWITVDDTGKRVYARLYTTGEHLMAITADGRVVRQD